MHRFIAELYPICRSITGDGVRETLRRIQQRIPLAIHEVPTGTQVFDWTVPGEWNIRDAYIRDAHGERVVDIQQSNLHVVSYSAPVRRRVPLAELREHLYTIPDHPEWIPYRTAYYAETWGFCLRHSQLLRLTDQAYDVCIDATLADGHLTYGECVLPGASPDEILISTHICHPSLCNDNLSGIAVATFLADRLRQERLRYSYRFLFIPGTIGAITWLALNEARLGSIKHGLVLACVGDPGPSTYKRSRRGDAEIDRAVAHVLAHAGTEYRITDFQPVGFDERQFCSPGFDLPMGCLMRTPHDQFPEYHTSADDLTLVQPAALADSFSKCLAALQILEHNRPYNNVSPKGEPQLGKRGLYRGMGGKVTERLDERALLWVLNLSDGRHTLLDIATRAGLAFDVIKQAADLLIAHRLLAPAAGEPPQ